MHIRPYQEADRPFLRSLYLAARQAAFTWRNTRNYRLEDFDRSTIGEEIWVAEQDGKLLGFVSIYRADNFIHNLYVDPCCRHKAWAARCCMPQSRRLPQPARSSAW